MISPIVFAAVNHVLDYHTEFSFSKHLRLNQVTDIKLDELVNLVLVCENVHDICFFIICNITSTTSNSYNSWFNL